MSDFEAGRAIPLAAFEELSNLDQWLILPMMNNIMGLNGRFLLNCVLGSIKTGFSMNTLYRIRNLAMALFAEFPPN